LRVSQTCVLLVPVRAKLVPITHGWWPPHILVGVGVHARLPIMLPTYWTPKGLEALCEKLMCQRLSLGSLLLL